MSRELRRVPLDFNYPIDKVWDGYLNPHYKQCPHCTGNGETAAMERLGSLVRLLMLSGSDSRQAKNHPYFQRISHYVSGFDSIPTPELAQLTVGLAGRDLGGFHDGVDNWSATRKIIEAAGLDPETWGRCAFCKGEGIDPESREAYDNWTETPPPTGEGYQLWGTTNEGTPKSPVFKTLGELCIWCEDNATTFGQEKTDRWSWMQMLSDGLVYHQSGNGIFL